MNTLDDGFSIVAGHPSLRGHHCTLRVWAPLSFTGGMKGMVGWVQNLSFLRLPSVDFPSRRAETNENKSETRRFGYVQIIHYRCVDVFIFINLYKISFIRILLFPGILFTSWEPRRNSSMALLFAFGF